MSPKASLLQHFTVELINTLPIFICFKWKAKQLLVWVHHCAEWSFVLRATVNGNTWAFHMQAIPQQKWKRKAFSVCVWGTDTLFCPAHLIPYLRDWIQICCCKKRFSAFVWGWLQVHLLCFSNGLVRNKQIWYLFSLTQTPSAFLAAFEVRWGFHWCLSLKKLIHHLEMPTAFIFYASLYLAARISWDLLGGFFSS